MKSARQVEEVHQATIDQDNETRDLHIVHDLINLSLLKPELNEHPVQERQLIWS